MRGAPIHVAVFLSVVFLAGCGGEVEAPPVTAGSPSSISATPTPVPPPTTATPSEPAEPTVMPVLRADGVGPCRFGEPVGDALPKLVAILGEPDEDETDRDRSLRGYLAEGDVGTARFVSWSGLRVVFLDRSGELPLDAVPFAAWSLHGGEAGFSFATAEGIGIGSTVLDLERAYGDRLTVPDQSGGPCGVEWVFSVRLPSGTLRGGFDIPPAPSIGSPLEPRLIGERVAIAGLHAGEGSSC